MKTLEQVAAYLLKRKIAFVYTPTYITVKDSEFKYNGGFEVASYYYGDTKRKRGVCLMADNDSVRFEDLPK